MPPPFAPLEFFSFDVGDKDVVPPQALSQEISGWWGEKGEPPAGTPLGVVDLVIDHAGRVVEARIHESVNRVYDAVLLESAKQWRYRPATRSGRPVRYRRLTSIALPWSAVAAVRMDPASIDPLAKHADLAATGAAAPSTVPPPFAPLEFFSFDVGDKDVVPPQALSQEISGWWGEKGEPPAGTPLGVVDLVIDHAGRVVEARIHESVNRVYDAVLLESAKQWRYRPATRSGRPVRYRRLTSIALPWSAVAAVRMDPASIDPLAKHADLAATGAAAPSTVPPPFAPLEFFSFDAGDKDVVPPQAVSQEISGWWGEKGEPPAGTPLGVVDLVIDHAGRVVEARIHESVNRVYDAVLLESAKQWRYRPATRSGRPVRYRRLTSIALPWSAVASGAAATSTVPPPFAPLEFFSFDAGDKDVVPPQALSQEISGWWGEKGEPPAGTPLGVVDLVIDHAGRVVEARIHESVNRVYDAVLLESAKQWRYRPATRSGRPVRYRHITSIVSVR